LTELVFSDAMAALSLTLMKCSLKLN